MFLERRLRVGCVSCWWRFKFQNLNLQKYAERTVTRAERRAGINLINIKQLY